MTANCGQNGQRPPIKAETVHRPAAYAIGGLASEYGTKGGRR